MMEVVQMTTRSPEQVLAGHVAEFGFKDSPIIAHLTWKASDPAANWQMFLYVFCGPQDRLEVLNKASAKTAGSLQKLLWDNALLTVGKLTGPKKTKRNANLQIAHLVRIAEGRDVDLAVAHRQALDACCEARVYATKCLAHLDLVHTMGHQQASLTQGQTTKAIKAICGFVNLFHQKICGTDVQLVPITSSDDERRFLLRLHQGNEAAMAAQKALLDTTMKRDRRLPLGTDVPDWIWDQRGTKRFLDE